MVTSSSASRACLRCEMPINSSKSPPSVCIGQMGHYGAYQCNTMHQPVCQYLPLCEIIFCCLHFQLEINLTKSGLVMRQMVLMLLTGDELCVSEGVSGACKSMWVCKSLYAHLIITALIIVSQCFFTVLLLCTTALLHPPKLCNQWTNIGQYSIKFLVLSE